MNLSSKVPLILMSSIATIANIRTYVISIVYHGRSIVSKDTSGLRISKGLMTFEPGEECGSEEVSAEHWGIERLCQDVVENHYLGIASVVPQLNEVRRPGQYVQWSRERKMKDFW
jgi:hypothetical protein